jgi:hypothetical protein
MESHLTITLMEALDDYTIMIFNEPCTCFLQERMGVTCLSDFHVTMGVCNSSVNRPGVCVNLGNDISYLDVNIVKISSLTMGGLIPTFHPAILLM